MRIERFATLMLFLGVIGASSASILIRLADAPPTVVAFYRLFYAALIHLVISAPKLGAYRAFDSKALLKTVLAGVALAIHFIFWFYSLEYTSVAASTVLVSLHPIFTGILAYLFMKEKLSSAQIICILFALCGTLLIAVGDYSEPGTIMGDALALAGALAVAVYFLIGRQVRANINTMPYTSLVYSFAAVTVLIVLTISGEPIMGYGSTEHILFVALAIVPTLFGHTLFNWALRHVQTFNVSASILGEPVGATILAFFILNELPNTHQLVGGALILVGLAFLTRQDAIAGTSHNQQG